MSVCERFNHYVYGRPVDVLSDHKPLVSITKKSLVSLSPRLQRLLLRLQKYEVNITYVPGKYMHVADTLSRACPNKQPTDADLNNYTEVMVHSLIANLPKNSHKWSLQPLKTKTFRCSVKLLRMVGHSIEGNCLFQLPITGIFVVWFMKQKVCCSLAKGSLSHRRWDKMFWIVSMRVTLALKNASHKPEL